MGDFPQTEREMIEAAETHMRPPDEPYGGRGEYVQCPTCGGSGDDPDDAALPCHTCDGEGTVLEDD